MSAPIIQWEPYFLPWSFDPIAKRPLQESHKSE